MFTLILLHEIRNNIYMNIRTTSSMNNIIYRISKTVNVTFCKIQFAVKITITAVN